MNSAERQYDVECREFDGFFSASQNRSSYNLLANNIEEAIYEGAKRFRKRFKNEPGEITAKFRGIVDTTLVKERK